jgi:UDP-N-acetylmuramoyl-tripeptide--D-alanyl-D-alanine ligase
VPDAGSAVTALGNLLGPGDVVLVKASRTIGLERVALALTGEAAK